MKMKMKMMMIMMMTMIVRVQGSTTPSQDPSITPPNYDTSFYDSQDNELDFPDLKMPNLKKILHRLELELRYSPDLPYDHGPIYDQDPELTHDDPEAIFGNPDPILTPESETEVPVTQPTHFDHTQIPDSRSDPPTTPNFNSDPHLTSNVNSNPSTPTASQRHHLDAPANPPTLTTPQEHEAETVVEAKVVMDEARRGTKTVGETETGTWKGSSEDPAVATTQPVLGRQKRHYSTVDVCGEAVCEQMVRQATGLARVKMVRRYIMDTVGQKENSTVLLGRRTKYTLVCGP